MASTQEDVAAWRTQMAAQHFRIVIADAKRELLVALAPLCVLLLFHFLSPNRTIYNASVSAWALFVTILVLLWPLCCLVVALVKTVVFKTITRTKDFSEKNLFVR